MDYVAVFNRGRGEEGGLGDDLQLRHWSEGQWQTLFAATTPRSFRASEVIIQRGGAVGAGQFPAQGPAEKAGDAARPVVNADGKLVAEMAQAGSAQKVRLIMLALIVPFKRAVYEAVLEEFKDLVAA